MAGAHLLPLASALAWPYPLSSSSSSRDWVLSELQCRHHMTTAAGAARAGAGDPGRAARPRLPPRPPDPGADPGKPVRPPRALAGPPCPAPAGSRSPRPVSPVTSPARPFRRRPPGVAQVRPEECGREGAGPQGRRWDSCGGVARAVSSGRRADSVLAPITSESQNPGLAVLGVFTTHKRNR